MSGHYPDGVTGRELEIAGPDSERDSKEDVLCWGNEECELFEKNQTVDGTEWTYDGQVFFDWKCPSCGHEYQEEFNFQDRYGPDPDDLRDAWLDR